MEKEKIRIDSQRYAPATAEVRMEGEGEELMRLDVVFATGTPVKRFDYENWRYFKEVLEISESAINTERMQNAPVLDSHSRYSTAEVVGRVESFEIVDGQARAVLLISARGELAGLRKDLKDGILKNISVGYTVQEYRQEGADTEYPTYTATRWTPMEISIVPVPADPASTIQGVRSETEPPTTDVTIWTTRAEESGKTVKSMQEDQKPSAEELLAAERTRIKELKAAARAASLGEEILDEWIANGTSSDEARAQALAHIEASQKPIQPAIAVNGSRDQDRKAELKRAAQQVIDLRTGGDVKEASPLLGEVRNLSLTRIAERMLEEQGVRTNSMSAREIARAALGLDTRLHTTSDFPEIFGNTVNRRLRQMYDNAEPTFQAWCQAANRTDYREGSAISLSGFSYLNEVAEGGEFTAGKMAESAEKYAVKKLGKLLRITDEMIVNDDLSAFARVPSAIANAAVRTHNQIVYSILTANAAMSDGVALFHADHGNLAASGSAISVTSLGAARAAMRKQKDQIGNPIYVTPAFLIVSPDKETEAQQVVQSQIVATKDSDTNPFKSSLQIIVDPHLTGNAWYLAAGNVDTIEYARINGEVFEIAQWIDYDRDALSIRVKAPFGAKAVDYRGLYKNPGA